MFNSFGNLFRVTTFGESHAAAVGAVVDGCPPRLALTEADIQPQLDRRRPGQSALASARRETDKVLIWSGTENGVTLGGPIALMICNQDVKPADYSRLRKVPRPSHADYTYRLKYGVHASSGGGRASARETVARVAAGAVAEKLLRERCDTRIVAWVSSIGAVDAADFVEREVTRRQVDASPVRCPDAEASREMVTAIEAARADGDSLGGVVTCVCRAVPPGLGEPVFLKMTSMLGAAMLSIPAARGVEIGSGFAGARMRGSEHNDLFVRKGRRLGTASNRSGGIQGGITNGEPVVFRVAFKPVASIAKAQATAGYDGRRAVLSVQGRHDPCIVARAVPVVESMAALCLADALLMAARLSD